MKKKIFAAICSVTMMAGAAASVPALDFIGGSDAIVAEAAASFSGASTEAWYSFTYTNGYNANAGYKITYYQPYQWVENVHMPDWVTDNDGHSGSLTAIGDSILNGNTKILSITVPNTVKSIGSRFCTDASKLTSVTLSDNLETLGDWGLYGCSQMNQFICKSVKLTNFGYGSLWANKWADNWNNTHTDLKFGDGGATNNGNGSNSTFLYRYNGSASTVYYYNIKYVYDYAFGADAWNNGNKLKNVYLTNAERLGREPFKKCTHSTKVHLSRNKMRGTYGSNYVQMVEYLCYPATVVWE